MADFVTYAGETYHKLAPTSVDWSSLSNDQMKQSKIQELIDKCKQVRIAYDNAGKQRQNLRVKQDIKCRVWKCRQLKELTKNKAGKVTLSQFNVLAIIDDHNEFVDDLIDMVDEIKELEENPFVNFKGQVYRKKVFASDYTLKHNFDPYVNAWNIAVEQRNEFFAALLEAHRMRNEILDSLKQPPFQDDKIPQKQMVGNEITTAKIIEDGIPHTRPIFLRLFNERDGLFSQLTVVVAEIDALNKMKDVAPQSPAASTDATTK